MSGDFLGAEQQDVADLRNVESLLEELPEPPQLTPDQLSLLTTNSPDPDQDSDGIRGMKASCMVTYLIQEVERFAGLLTLVREDLGGLRDAMKGIVVMSARFEELQAALRVNAVPATWIRAGYPSLKPLRGWTADLRKRVEFLQSWAFAGRDPACYWISYFFFPQGFLTGVLQAHARKTQIPIDVLGFEHQVRSDLRNANEVFQPPEIGVHVFGPYLEGGRWDVHGKQIEDCRPGEMFSRLPVVHFIPKNTDAQSGEGGAAQMTNPRSSPDRESEDEEATMFLGFELRYLCPLYKTANRVGEVTTTGQSTNFVTAVNLPTTVEPDVWVLKGVALICEIDD